MADQPAQPKAPKTEIGSLALNLAKTLAEADRSEAGREEFVRRAMGAPSGLGGSVRFAPEGRDPQLWLVAGPEVESLLSQLSEPEAVEEAREAPRDGTVVRLTQAVRAEAMSPVQARAMLYQGCDWQLSVAAGAIRDDSVMGIKWMFRREPAGCALRFSGPSIEEALGAIAAAEAQRAIGKVTGPGVAKPPREKGVPRDTGL